MDCLPFIGIFRYIFVVAAQYIYQGFKNASLKQKYIYIHCMSININPSSN